MKLKKNILVYCKEIMSYIQLKTTKVKSVMFGFCSILEFCVPLSLTTCPPHRPPCVCSTCNHITFSSLHSPTLQHFLISAMEGKMTTFIERLLNAYFLIYYLILTPTLCANPVQFYYSHF